MQAEHGIDPGIVERALLHHQPRAAFLSLGRAFFGGLKEEHDYAGDLFANAGEDFGDAEENGHVRIVAACVHDADFLAVVGRAHLRLERRVDLFGDRQRVHVGAKSDDAAWLAAAEHADDAGVRDSSACLIRVVEAVGHELGGTELAVAELRVLVNVAAAADHGGFGLCRGLVDLSVEGGAAERVVVMSAPARTAMANFTAGSVVDPRACQSEPAEPPPSL